MKNSDRNLMVLQNFILHITHSSEGDIDANESLSFTTNELYQLADDYIEEDHADGRGNEYDDEELFLPPNGTRNYLETYFEVVDYITQERLKNYSEFSPLFKDIQEASGTCGFWDLAIKWTNEFEKLNKDRFWDGEFYEAVEEFCKIKNKSE